MKKHDKQNLTYSEIEDFLIEGFSFNWIRVSAITLLILISAMPFQSCSNQIASTYGERLAMQYFETPSKIAIAKKGGANPKAYIEALKQKVEDFYEQRKYRDALKVLEQMVDDSSIWNVSQVYFSMGICHFLLKENESAVKSFLKVSSQDGIKRKADWYLTLTYLKQGDTVRAKELLKKVVEKEVNVKRKKKAKELLEQLEQELIT